MAPSQEALGLPKVVLDLLKAWQPAEDVVEVNLVHSRREILLVCQRCQLLLTKPERLDVSSVLGDGSDMGPIQRRTNFAPQNNPRRNSVKLNDKLTATSMYSSRESDTLQEVLKFLALKVPG